MGQYYMIVNLDKEQYLHPHAFGDGLKLMEFGSNGRGTMLALAVLLARGNGRGGGDLHSNNRIIGSWAGDRIVVTGDYADEIPKRRLGPKIWAALVKADPTWAARKEKGATLYHVAGVCYCNVSANVMAALMDDEWYAQTLAESAEKSWTGSRLLTAYKEAKDLRKLAGLVPTGVVEVK